MSPDQLQQRLTSIGILCRVQKDEVLIETCRFCGNTRWNLELNPVTGVYHCWACNAGGRLDRLLRDWLGQAEYIPVRISPDKSLTSAKPASKDFRTAPADKSPLAMRFLARRSIGASVVKQYGLAVCIESKHRFEGRLIIPVHDFWTDTVIGYIARSIVNERPKYLSTLEAKYITGYRVRSWKTPCVIVEGAFDGIAAHRAGFHAAVLSGTTNPGLREFGARMPLETPIAVLLDGDAAAAADRLGWALRQVRYGASGPVVVARLSPGLDPADFSPKALQLLITKTLAQQANYEHKA